MRRQRINVMRQAPHQTMRSVYGLRGRAPDQYTPTSHSPDLLAMDAPEYLPAGSHIAWMAGPVRVECEELFLRGGHVF